MFFRSYRILKLISVVFFLGITNTASAATTNLVLNPSFETLGQANWTAVINGPTAWTDSSATPPTTDGTNGVYSNPSYVSSQILYQDVILPATGTYTFQISAGCTFSGGSSINDFCRADITNTNAATLVAPNLTTDTLATTGANVLQTIYTRDGAQGSQAQADTAQVNITGLAGQTVRIRLMAQASSGPVSFNIDNVRLMRTDAIASVPTLSGWSMLILSGLLVLAAGVTLRRRQT